MKLAATVRCTSTLRHVGGFCAGVSLQKKKQKKTKEAAAAAEIMEEG